MNVNTLIKQLERIDGRLDIKIFDEHEHSQLRPIEDKIDVQVPENNAIIYMEEINSETSHNSDFKSPSAKPCQECNGTGKIIGDYITAKCIQCGGTGKAS